MASKGYDRYSHLVELFEGREMRGKPVHHKRTNRSRDTDTDRVENVNFFETKEAGTGENAQYEVTTRLICKA